MKIYSKHLLLRLIGAFAVINFVFIGLVSLLQLLKFIYLLGRGAALLDVVDVIVLSMPALLYMILPISTLISIMYCYYTLSQHHEIVLLRSYGLSNWQIARPALLFAIIVGLLASYISISLAPSFVSHLKNRIFEIRNTKALNILHENAFNYVNKDLSIYLGDKLGPNYFQNLVIFNKSQDSKLFIAKSGELVLKNSILILYLQDGLIQSYAEKSRFDNIEFKNFELQIDLANYGQRNNKEISEYSLSQLLDSKENKLLVEGHQKIIWPMYNFLLVFFALSYFLSKIKFLTTDYIKLVLLLLIIVLMYFALYVLAVKHLMFLYAQYFLVLLIFLISYYKLSEK